MEPRLLVDPPVASLDDYRARGGGRALERSRELGPDATIEEVRAAGIRGRGGAGFPAGVKWRSVADASGGHRYSVCNAAEGEPGTFKDRALLRANPYQVLEGLLIAAGAVGAADAFVGLKASFEPERTALERALAELHDAGWLGDVSVSIAAGPDEYLFGEEKALLEVIEGADPLPRWLPPYLHGLYATAPQLGWEVTATQPGHVHAHEANPTLVNNAETLADATWVLAHGVDAFRSVGTEESPGTLLCTVVGDVQRPGVLEVAMGTPFSELVERCGGTPGGLPVKAVFPGVANPLLPGDAVDTPLTYEHFRAAGSGIGAAGFMVYDTSACMVEVATTFSRFLWVESCGQCPPCKFGSGQITAALERLRVGDGTDADLGLIERHLRAVTDGNRCYLPVQEQALVSSVLRAFPDDVAAHLEGWCPSERQHVVLPKLTDLADGVARYDVRQERKQPDWTYEPG